METNRLSECERPIHAILLSKQLSVLYFVTLDETSTDLKAVLIDHRIVAQNLDQLIIFVLFHQFLKGGGTFKSTVSACIVQKKDEKQL